jgi:sterol desaturase/sphingolipid hydroxylase (fatty acid hydroxylase superfamily)
MGVIFTTIYWLKSPFFERYKAEPEPWPWEADPKQWQELLGQSIQVVCINLFLLVPTISFSQYYFGTPVRLDFGVDSFPTISTFILQMVFCALCADFVFYWSHRTLHTRWLYRHVHKIHHLHKDTVWYATATTHPVEFILGNALPALTGVMILGPRMHVTTAIGWLFSNILKSI